jgi:hypothetical protein
MKFNFLKQKKEHLPSLESLKPRTFDVNMFWFASLGLFLVASAIVVTIGAKILYSQYFESYKKSVMINSENLINVNRLKSVIEKRNNFINNKISIPKDPSFGR